MTRLEATDYPLLVAVSSGTYTGLDSRFTSRFFAVVRHRQTGVQLSGLGYALANDLAGVVDRESTGQLHKRPWIPDEIVEVLWLFTLPYQGATPVWIIRLHTKANDLASIINSVATAGYGRYGSGKSAVV